MPIFDLIEHLSICNICGQQLPKILFVLKALLIANDM